MSTKDSAPVVVAPSSGTPLVRADSAFYGHAVVGAALRAGADVSVTVRLDKRVKATIATISDDAWTPIEYTAAVFDEQTKTWVSRAEVAEIAEIEFTANAAWLVLAVMAFNLARAAATITGPGLARDWPGTPPRRSAAN